MREIYGGYFVGKNIDVSFSYGTKDLNNIIRNIVIRKIDLYKENLIKGENRDDINEEKIGVQQLLGCNKK